MNILDVMEKEEAPAPETGDRLDQIFRWQSDLEEKYIKIEDRNGLRWSTNHPLDLSEYKDRLQLQEFSFRTGAEIYEMTECLKNRPHKATHMPTDRNHFFEEFSDTFHFLIGIAWLLGMDSHTFFEAFVNKPYVLPEALGWDKLDTMMQLTGDIEAADLNEAPERRWTTESPLVLDDPRSQMQIKQFCWNVVRNLVYMSDTLYVDSKGRETSLCHAVREFLTIGHVLGMSNDDIYKVYWAKMRVNQFRQESNY